MDNGGHHSNDNGWMFSSQAHLPAVVPFSRLPVVVPLPRRVAVPFWGLILLATAGSVLVGALAAIVWPWEYRNKTSRSVAMLPYSSNASPPGIVEVPALAEVSKIDLGLPSQHTANLSPPDLTTTDLTISAPATAGPVKTAPAFAPIEPAAAEPPVQAPGDGCQVKLPGPQLVSTSSRMRSGEPASLGLTVDGAPDDAHLLICGFATKSVFSIGRAVDENTWTVPASKIAETTIVPPSGFVGSMDIAVTLTNADKTFADRRIVHLQWLPKTRPVRPTPTAPRGDDVNLDSLLNYAAHLKSVGSLADARQIFRRVAQTGDPRGAFMLAESYDPISLAKHQLLPVDSDLELARIWYRKASDLGSPDAIGRLDRLTNW